MTAYQARAAGLLAGAFATQAEAESGTNQLAWMSSLRTKQFLDAELLRGLSARASAALITQPGGLIGGFGAHKTSQYFELTTTSVIDVIDYTRPLAYDAQTVNFTTNRVLTGQTSGATATIRRQTDAGATGTLDLYAITGTFIDNEIITDTNGGSATVNGVIGAKAFDSTLSNSQKYDWRNTLMVMREDRGSTYENTSSVGKSAVGLYVQSYRTNYLTDTSKGQNLAARFDSFLSQVADGGAMIFTANRAYVTGGGALSGATSGVEGQGIMRDQDGATLLSLGAMLFSLPPYQNTAIEWLKQGVAFRAQLTSDSDTSRGDTDTIKAYSAFLAEDAVSVGVCDGFLNVVSAHQTSSLYPYFRITGKRHPDGGGLVRAGVGAVGTPGLSFSVPGTGVDEPIGLYRVSNGVIGMGADAAGGTGVQAQRWSNSKVFIPLTLHVHDATAIPAGGTAGVGILLSSTSNFGIFFGSEPPTLSAAKGSLYLRSNGSTTNDRAYINTNGGTTWTPLVTVG